MPILKYRCKSCDKTFSKILVSPLNAPKKCPVCGAPDPEELGESFHYDEASAARSLCLSCDSCGTDSACHTRSSG
jgi:putative FmdB family regulatory protein